MPFKRKIAIREAPKRSGRKAGGRKRKITPANQVKDRKGHAPQL